jgi:small-conductance mechanosensitive channel
VLNVRATRLESSQWLTEVENDLDQLRRTERFIEGRRSEFLQDLEALRGGAEPTDPEAVAWREERMAAMATLTQEYERARDQIVQERQFLRHLQRELRAETTALDPIGRLRSLLTRLRESLDREVFVVDDRPISVGKLLVAFVLFAVSISLSRVLARGIGRLLYRRLLEPGAAEAFQSLTFYGLLVAFFLFALRTVNIPLTAFALLGGALAIGLGFGSQNVIGNFISGLILLVERPIKVNDIVEVDGVNGIVERVGPRSTRIRTFDNLHIIVPNSAFLDRNVVNWTLSDQVVRRSILVGVGYDSSPRDVQRLVLRALEEHGVVLRNPPPKVLLGDFGADSLVFRAYFWLRLEPNVSFLDIESDLRRRILQLFREAGIVISFPQRDVHFDAAQPIAVRVLPQPPEEPKAG